jgi:hypothetical protein
MTGKRLLPARHWLLLEAIELARIWAEQDRTVCSPDTVNIGKQ